MMILKPKPALDEFIKTCTPLLKIPELEKEIRSRIQEIVVELLIPANHVFYKRFSPKRTDGNPGVIHMLKKYIDRVVNDDCLKVLSAIEDDSIDMCFADPPFNLEKKYTSYNDQRPPQEYLEWCEQWLHELWRVTKPTGSIFIHNIPRWLTYYSAILNGFANFRHWIAWDAMSNPLGKTLLPAHYGILFYTKHPKDFKFYDVRAPHKHCRVCNAYLKDYGGKKDQMHPFGTLVSDVWTDIHRIRHNVRRDEHPCQLPIPLLERLVLMSTDPGDLVLDPFLGTGTTAIAAKALGRHYVGIELDPEYVEIAKSKLAHVRLSTHGDFFVSKYLGKIQSIRDIDAAKIFPPQLTSGEKKRLRAISKDNGHTPNDQLQMLEQSARFVAKPVRKQTRKGG